MLIGMINVAPLEIVARANSASRPPSPHNLTLTPLPKHRLFSILRSTQSTTRRARKLDETRVSKIIQKNWRKVETLRPRFAESCQNKMMEVPSKGNRILELLSGLVFHRQLRLPMQIADIIRRLPRYYQFWVHNPDCGCYC